MITEYWLKVWGMLQSKADKGRMLCTSVCHYLINVNDVCLGLIIIYSWKSCLSN